MALTFLPQLHAQTATNRPPDPNAKAANAQLPGQAPDEMTKKISELVHAGKYGEAQHLTTGVLVAYPNDQRLIKAKALIEKLLSPAGPATAASASSQPADNGVPALPATVILTGMDKVEYNSLIELARQAQQTADLPQQKTLLQQFMDQSGVFLQKHPDQTLLWQLRVASALSLNDPMAGYEAGQRLLAAGAADSDDPNLQRLLAQLKNKSWLDRRALDARQATYGWLLGTWSFRQRQSGQVLKVEFSRSGSDINGYYDGVKSKEAGFRATFLDSGELRWERNNHNQYEQPGWQAATAFETTEDKKTMTIVFPIWLSGKTEPDVVRETLEFKRVDSRH
jgi:hypothetical protein